MTWMKTSVALVLALGGCSPGEPERPPDPMGTPARPPVEPYDTLQGTRLHGGLRGGQWQGASFAFTAIRRADSVSAVASASVRGGALEVRTQDGGALAGPELAGAVLLGTTSFRTKTGRGQSAVQVRIEAVLPHASLYGSAPGRGPACGAAAAGEYEYQASISLSPAESGAPARWEPLCSGGAIYTTCPGDALAAQQRAMPFQGDWTADGYKAAMTRVSFACLDGVIAKCTDWGYKPWVDAALHEVCTRMGRANYLGFQKPRTLDGTPIEIFDGQSTAVVGSRGYRFEAGWRVAGPMEAAVVCLSKMRWSTLPIGGYDPAILPDPRTRRPGGRFCPDTLTGPADLAALKAMGAVLFNNSSLIDAGLYRWLGPGGESYTTTRYALSGYDAATGRAESEPPELAASGFIPARIDATADARDPTGFEGSVFRHPVPRPWVLPGDALPLHTWIRGDKDKDRDRPADYLLTTVADPNQVDVGAATPPPADYRRQPEPEGYVLAPPAPQSVPPYPEPPAYRGYRTVGLYTWWDPTGRHYLTTADLSMDHRSCQGGAACRPGDRHQRKPHVFVRLEGYLLCLGCPIEG